MKTIITFFLALTPLVSVLSQSTSFEHVATDANTTDHRTYIDNEDLNDNSSAVIAVSKIRKIVDGVVKRNPHQIQVGYDEMSGRHYIQNKDTTKPMPIGSCYKIVVVSSGTTTTDEVTVTEDNLPFPNVVEVGDNIFVLANDRIIATEKVNPAVTKTNDTPFLIGHDYLALDTWNIISTPSHSFSLGTQFNLIDVEEYFIGIHTSPAESIGGYANSITDFANWTRLNFDAIDGNADAGVFVQLYWESGNNLPDFFVELSSFYNPDVSRWEVHTELEEYISDFVFPTFYRFLVYATNPTLSTSESTLVEGIKSFPNPVNDSFNIESKVSIQDVSLFNLLGQKLNTIQGNGTENLQINVSNYSAGHYFAKVNIGNQIETIRFVKK